MSKLTMALLALFTLLMVSSCGDDVDTCETTDLTYTSDIQAILDASCTNVGCHNTGSANGGMATYAGAEAFANSGRLIGAINHEATFKPMPYPTGSAKIAQCNIDKITAWVNDGAPE